MNYTPFTSEEFKTATGLLLDNRVEGLDDESTKVARFINDVCEQIKDYIIQNDFGHIDFEDISETQNSIINRAAMEQAKWVLSPSAGDARYMSGYNAVNNTLIPIDQINKIVICPTAKKLLLSRIIQRTR
jgi:frataxin-like iron-binding protein CyaY